MIDTRPAAARTDFSDLSAVDKYVMPTAEYESRTDSVLAWKKAQKLGRFDPNAPTIEQQKILASEREVEERGKLSILFPRFVHPTNALPSRNRHLWHVAAEART